jgi:hypothetical protein
MKNVNKWLPFVLGAMLVSPVVGADRIVLCEEFTATT